MKNSIKLIAAAALVATSGFASAAIDNGKLVNGAGEVFMIAYDSVSAQTFSFDTGVSMSSLLPSATSGLTFSLGSDFTTYLSTASTSTRWGVFATDTFAPNSFYTTALGTVATNPNATKIGNASGFLSSFVNNANFNGTHATQANGSAIIAHVGGLADFGSGNYIEGAGNNFNGNVSFVTSGLLSDTSLNFYSFTNGTPGGSTRTQFGTADGVSTWKLNTAANTLSFVTATAPVPEPSTYALAIAGLAVVGALSRRKQAAK